MNPHQEIINSLSECIAACEQCAKACLEEENIKPMANCIKISQECSNICSLGIQLLSGESILADAFIGLCADICTHCARECEKHDQNYCKKCADACHRCKEICKTYLDDRRQAAMNV